MAGCCVFLLPRRPSSLGYRLLTSGDGDGRATEDPSSAAVTVVVGKERREFLVDPVVLEKDLFRVLLGVARRSRGGGEKGGKKRKRGGRDGEPIFVNVDAILFEHLLWLAGDGGEKDGRRGHSLLQQDLEEIIEFYAQDC